MYTKDSLLLKLAPVEGDDPELLRLLAASDLVTEDLLRAPARFFLALDEGVPVACCGYEKAGSEVMLRSIAVDPRLQGRGYAAALLPKLEMEALQAGPRRLWLITTTAEAYFARHQYRAQAREHVPAGVLGSEQASRLCGDEATIMVKTSFTDSRPYLSPPTRAKTAPPD